MFLLNSRLGLFSAASVSGRLPLSLSYGVILPSSLTTILSLALGFSPHLPVSVCGTGSSPIYKLFSSVCNRLLRYLFSLPFAAVYQRRGQVMLLRPLYTYRLRRLRNLHRMCISYASRPRLSPRLTLSGRTFLRKP